MSADTENVDRQPSLAGGAVTRSKSYTTNILVGSCGWSETIEKLHRQ